MTGDDVPGPATRAEELRAWLLHLYTASGVVLAFLAARELFRPEPDPRWVFVWLGLAVVIDATDGPLARRWEVLLRLPQIQGRTIDDIVDYITFTFLPLLLVWRMGWLPAAWSGVLVSAAMVASLFGFSNVGAKAETEGFFLGFPSYWNIYAFYAGLMAARGAEVSAAVVLTVLAVLTVAPVRFIYPNKIAQPWRTIVFAGAALWTASVVVMLPAYPQASSGLFWASLMGPLLYALLSVWLDVRARAGGGP